ncbi:MAG: 5'-nucleotidase, lipoprotein e(P4) family [Alphaproteobacteria bacterium]|nr:5'-nucleotidase, lipoprotein e(P4) family [Alphaproteobacteria bacterium]
MFAVPAIAADAPPADDNLNAVLWMQRSVEYKGATMGAFALARVRLDQALADKTWTAAPVEQTGTFAEKPPAVIVDVDETVMDNSGYQAWNVTAGTSFSPKTWTQFVDSRTSTAIPGAVDFAKYAASKGVKVFYVTNRNADEKPSTAKNLEALGFPMGGNVDTVLASREKPDWSSQKGTRRAYIAKDYRILLLLGDNFGDFTDDYRGSEAERMKVFEANAAHWGRDWIVLPNPAYGSFESAPYGHDFKKAAGDQRAAKRGALTPWAGPK